VSAEAADPGPRSAPSNGVALSWLGHSTVLIELDGVRVLTDPVLRHRIGHLVRIAPRIGASEVGVTDCVLLSHLHADHADIPTLRAVARSGPIVVPTSTRTWLTRRGLSSVIGLSVGDEIGVGTVAVRAVPARHAGSRWPSGPAGAALGFLIRGSRCIYFAGDTDMFEAMADLRGSVDVALLPVWGWGPSVGEGHLDPERAARAAALIEPAVAVPIHWGTYALPRPIRPRSDPARPAREFADLVRCLAPHVEVRVLAPGGLTRL
jgi:L-ascorbate metabolism protein UlaG (beta-lactamase superfamily)